MMVAFDKTHKGVTFKRMGGILPNGIHEGIDEPVHDHLIELLHGFVIFSPGRFEGNAIGRPSPIEVIPQAKDQSIVRGIDFLQKLSPQRTIMSLAVSKMDTGEAKDPNPMA